MLVPLAVTMAESQVSARKVMAPMPSTLLAEAVVAAAAAKALWPGSVACLGLDVQPVAVVVVLLHQMLGLTAGMAVT
jgi:hypothetical protein